MKKIQPVLIIQGGAGKSSGNERRTLLLRKKIRHILKLSYQKLSQTSALEAATFAVRLLEDDPEFNAGTGSRLQADGHARLSASVMDGARRRFGGVINIEHIKNPILVARQLLEEKSRVLSGHGAYQFARKMGMKSIDTRTKRAIQRWKKTMEKGSDTVGACALDRCGNLSSATSTGGRGLEFPGRVSDSGMPVANYADEYSAISASGIGEEIIDEGLAIRIAQRVQDKLPLPQAFRKTFREIEIRGRKIGAVGLDRKGNVAYEKTTDILIFGWQKGKKQVIF